MSVRLDALSSLIININSSEEVGALPSKEQAQKTFWGLGERFWMQIIDGKFHEYGSDVFDKALHKGVIEKKFFKSLKIGCEFTSEHVTEKPTVQFYKDLHKNLCSHFKGEENNTEISADRTGIFRYEDVKARFSIKAMSEESLKHYFFVEVYESSKSEFIANEKYQSMCSQWIDQYSPLINPSWIKKWKLEWENEKNIAKTIADQYPISRKWVLERELEWDNKVEAINNYVTELSLSMNVCNLMSISRIDHDLFISYDGTGLSEFEKLVQKVSGNCSENSERIEKTVQILFDRYNQKIDDINSKLKSACANDQAKQFLEEKVKAISDLYQLLEWLHPFPDGQGRTDLVLQAKLLCEQGLNPAILDQPYFSSYSLPSESAEYLLNGIKRWKEEQNRG